VQRVARQVGRPDAVRDARPRSGRPAAGRRAPECDGHRERDHPRRAGRSPHWWAGAAREL